MPLRSRSSLQILAPVVLVWLATSVAAAAPDWEAVADEKEIVAVTVDEDGEARETTIWLAVRRGEGYIRTGNTRWGKNVVRDPDLTLRIAGTDYDLRAEFVEDDIVRELVTEVFREKYGWSDAMLGWVRGSRPKIMRLHGR